MSDLELDRMLSAASPVADAEIDALDLDAAEVELMGEIVALPTDTFIEESASTRRPGWRGRKRYLAGATAIAAVSLVVAGIFTGTTPTERGDAFSAAAQRVAAANSRVLLGAGWKVVRADEFTVDQGEMTFSDGRHSVDLFWERADQHDFQIEQAQMEGEDVSEVEVLGHTATMFRYAKSTDYVTVLPPQGSNYIYIRGDLGGEEAYRAMLEELRAVDAQTWLEAMPASVVRPDNRAAAVDEMLQGVPIPPGFDRDKLRGGDAVKDRYQLGAQVVSAVACGWLDIWSEAKESGNTAKVDEAIAAMQTSHDWRVLDEMNDEGDYPEVLWEYADAMKEGGTVATGKGLVAMTRENYTAALGCEAVRTTPDRRGPRYR